NTTMNKLVNCYRWNIQDNKSRSDWYIKNRYNTHNQLIDFYLSTGAFSLILFLLFFINLIYRNRKSYFIVAMSLSMFIFELVENIFHRQVGELSFGIFLILVLIVFKIKRKDSLYVD